MIVKVLGVCVVSRFCYRQLFPKRCRFFFLSFVFNDVRVFIFSKYMMSVGDLTKLMQPLTFVFRLL